ncbi:unnamed protein product [Dibothriocephalus latus]|uniref:Uncharacterized protein n=1 Tax=Dibothriocephalus latus TaxID=60516 RepID=A0A3P7N7X3_DIBLA|nr:unnamed protein product [Dibothriocephalus latus]
MARKQECYRIVALHGLLFACCKIGQGLVTFAMGIHIYVLQYHIRSNEGWRRLVFLCTIRDLFMLLELCVHMVHTWTCYMWQLNLHNCGITHAVRLFRPFKRIRRFLAARLYQDEVILETRENKKKRKKKRRDLDYIYVNYLQTLSSRLTEERLEQCLGWLVEHENLPQELTVFMENMGY